MTTTTQIPVATIADSDGIIHACERRGMYFVSLCEHLNAEIWKIDRVKFQTADDVTCDHCHLLLLKADAD